MKKNVTHRCMVDVSAKDKTNRKAIAESIVALGPKAYKALVEHQSPKGDVLETARVSGIMAAKKTAELIALCHPLELSSVKLSFKLNPKKYQVIAQAEVTYTGKTGVEMEALTAVSIAALTIYDMLKWVDHGIEIVRTVLTYKSGGKSGVYAKEQ